MLYDGGKYDLCFRSAKALQTADEFIELIGAFENGLNEYGILARYVTAFDDLGRIL